MKNMKGKETKNFCGGVSRTGSAVKKSVKDLLDKETIAWLSDPKEDKIWEAYLSEEEKKTYGKI